MSNICLTCNNLFLSVSHTYIYCNPSVLLMQRRPFVSVLQLLSIFKLILCNMFLSAKHSTLNLVAEQPKLLHLTAAALPSKKALSTVRSNRPFDDPAVVAAAMLVAVAAAVAEATAAVAAA